MKLTTPSQPRPLPLPLWCSLVGLMLILLGGGIFLHQFQNQTPEQAEMLAPPFVSKRAELEALISETHIHDMDTAFYSCSISMENGQRIIRVQVIPNGEEYVFDGTTGKLIDGRKINLVK